MRKIRFHSLPVSDVGRFIDNTISENNDIFVEDDDWYDDWDN